MAAAAVAPAPLDWQALTSSLNKKTSFEQATRQACDALGTAGSAACGQPAFRHLLSRARTLLRSRYSSRPFWVAGRQLFMAAQEAASSSGHQELVSQLAEYIAECNAFLREEPESSSSGGAAAATATAGAPGAPSGSGSYLFEGQLSGQEQPPPRPLGLLDLLGGALGQQLAAAAAATAAGQAQQDGQAQQGTGAGHQEEAQQQGPEQQQGDRQQQGADQQPPPPEVLEALERELDAIAVQIMEETGQAAAAQRAAPPASKKVVASLPVESLTAERLQQLGGAGVVRCPVCMEDLSEGEEVQVMPCNQGHVFHPACLRPWLEEHNSCPTCRHELPTDDHQYERRKEREREEAEERRGAENAVSHNEFLYI